MTRERPVFLQLTKLRYPITAIVSILHRISGIIILLSLPLFLYLLHESLISQADFNEVQDFLDDILVKLALWIALSAVAFHLFAGIRHMMMDIGLAESLTAARMSSIVVIVLTAIAIVLLGGWLWL